MKLLIKHKIFFLVLFSIIAAFTISFYIYYTNLKNYATQNAYKESSHDIKMISIKIDEIKKQNDSYIKRLVSNSDIISSLNLISNYQDKTNYDKEVFNTEKKKIMSKILNIIGVNNFWSAQILDIRKDVVAFKRKKNDKVIIGYSDFDKQKLIIRNKYNNEITSFKPKELKKNILTQFNITKRDDEFIFNTIVSIKDDSTIIGYLKVSFILNKLNYNDFTNGISNNLIIINDKLTLDTAVLPIKYNYIKNLNNNSFTEYKNFFLNSKKILSNDSYIISYINKDKFNENLFQTIKDLIYTSIFIFILLLIITSMFTNRFITRPLQNLLTGIKQLKDKKEVSISLNSNDEISTIAKEFNDISSQLQNSFESLENNNILLENIINTVPMSIFIKDKDGIYIMANKLFVNDCGFTTDKDILGKTDFDIWTKKDANTYREKDMEVIASLKPLLNYEENQTRYDNTQKILLSSKMPLIDRENNTIGILGVYKDITIEKQKETALKEKEKYLMHQSKLAQMGEMISMIAHQWRQPLAAISSTTNSLLLKTMMGKYESNFFSERLENISNYSQHLSSTIDDFRNFFKKNKEKRDILLETIADDSLRIIQISIENRNIQIIKEYNNKQSLSTYPNELRQVVLNILKNAEDALSEKEQDNKYIRIKTYKDKNENILEISDNAGGIPAKIMDKIFEPYYSTKTNKDGTGLGLYMSKVIVEDNCSGKLTVSNNEDGAIFKVIL